MKNTIVSNELLNIDRNLLGNAVFAQIVSDSKSCEEIGQDIMDTLYDCKSQEDYELVNSIVRAITGCSLEHLTNYARQMEADAHEL